MIAPTSNVRCASPLTDLPTSRFDRVRWYGGLFYLVFTLASGVSYVTFLGPSMTNNLYWPHYNATGYQVFLIDLLNIKLQTTSHDDSVDVLSVDATILKSYASLAVQPDFYNNYARRVLLSELNTLEKGIQGMRSTVPSRMASPYVQYCWVDFNRRWDIAHTDARSQRCRQRYQNNAAVYLELLARNVDWGEFLDANSESWPVVIGAALQAAPDGAQWLADRPTHAKALTVDAEVAYLIALKLTRYQLQWQNEIQMGFTEAIVVRNTYNYEQTVPIKAMGHVWGPWTSINMFWNFRNDLGTLRSLNVSLIRGAPNYFQTVGGSDFFSSQLGLQDATGNYVAQTGAFYFNIGPFGSVDLLYVQVPRSLTLLYSEFVQHVLTTVGATASLLTAYQSIPTIGLTPFPPNFGGDGLTYHGGNLLCLINPGTPFLQAQFAFDDACSIPTRFTILGTNKNMLFALFASGATNLDAICSLQDSANCISTLTQVQSQLSIIGATGPSFSSLRQQATLDMPIINVTQYAQDILSNWLILQQPLLTPDPHWSFYGWLTLFDWAEGQREVVSVEGDLSIAVVMSERFPIVQLTTTGDNRNAQFGPQVLYFLMLYTTFVLLALGVCVMLCIIRERYCIHGANLLKFNRVAGVVWIGRPILVLRGFIAAVVLGTCQTVLTIDRQDHTSFHAAPRSVYATLLVAGEATWIVYVINDVLVVVARRRTAKWEAMVASTLAWLVTVVVDLALPISLSASVARDCTTQNAFEYLDCRSGVVTVGQLDRILLLGLVDALSIGFACGLVAWCNRDRSPRPEAPWHIHGSAQAYIDSRPARRTSRRQHPHSWQLDSAAAVMSGTLPMTIRGQAFAFDVKLWVVHPVLQGGVLPRSSLSTNVSTSRNVDASDGKPSVTWRAHVVTLCGLGYLMLTTIGSVSYIALSQINFANDFYWASFNMTGHHVAIADWFHLQLALDGKASAIRLDDAKFSTIDIDYADPTLQVTSSPWYGARLLFESLNTLPMAIQGLRRTDGCATPWIFTQYCWLDFGRQWPMANSQARQQRCRLDDENGALYFESVLRNIQWSKFDDCWGNAFDIAFRRELEMSAEGQQWLKATLRPTSVDDEVSYWTTFHISHYTVQWQNFKFPGLINTYSIENAFGTQYPMTLSHSNGSFSLAAQTSYKMYWGLANDFWAVTQNQTCVGGLSLIRTSAHFAFANHTMLDVLVQNRTLNLPLYAAYDLVQSQIGPFGSIDMKSLACPASVKRLASTGTDVLRELMAANALAANAYVDIAPAILSSHFTLPTQFMAKSAWLAFGGNILCQDFGNTAVQLGLYQYTSRVTPCGQWVTTLLLPTKTNVLLAAMAARLIEPNTDLDAICSHDTVPQLCLDSFLGPSVVFLQRFLSNVTNVASVVVAAVADVRSIQPSLMQYVRENGSQPLQMLSFALLDPLDPTFDFWSWLHLLEWAAAEREVVAFQGDVGSIHLLTEWIPPVSQQVQASELPTTFTYFALGGVEYITCVMFVISILVLVHIVASHMHFEPSNLFKVNRVAGIVWVGRPLLLLRSVTALSLLSTATLDLVVQNRISRFHVPTVPWYKTILGAGETTWLVFILNDIFTVWTKQFTAYYATPSSFLVWLVAAMVTLVKPVVHAATIQPECQIDDMDFQVVCSSGVILIGQIQRFYVLVAIVCGCNVVCYVLARLRYWHVEDDKKHILHLSSGAKYFLDRTDWMHRGIYHIDAASAVLMGLVVIRYRGSIYFIDVKLWRSFAIVVPYAVPPRLRFTLPLTE
ncbi:Aste57867_13560 [Aphanomyces stellatus]|uniref:Aste57867_13560 protein n=1 Tax=Aphanomyces stellatus TaxID=120398 RepID=A0A485KZB3_9STRA|nr:hypothetical protein As57867_013510 [Aphanomyces stellatus]VFT90398.1 Aste57867_13560 [Aphanomyces stellatus]